MSNHKKFLIDFEPIGRRIEVKEGSTILTAAQEAGIELIAICGGTGTCGKCKVQIKNQNAFDKKKNLESVFSEEQIKNGWCLACQKKITQSLKVFIPKESLSSKQRLQIESSLDKITVQSIFSIMEFDNQSDPIMHKSNNATNSFRVNKKADIISNSRNEINDQEHKNIHSNNLINSGNKVLRNGVPIASFSNLHAVYGLAVDLGTTKLAAYLVDLLTGRTVASASEMNPQISYGEDIISRILFCIQEPEGSQVLKKLVVETINKLCQEMCNKNEISKEHILEAVIVGNTAMHHLFLGLPVKQLGLSPFEPYESKSLFLNAKELGIDISSSGKVYFPENIAGYIGGDHIAMVVAANQSKNHENVICVDIGTNTEISLFTKEGVYSCSCASGPAFEGAHIKNGMRAVEGAIERVIITDDEVQFQTIGQKPPIGLCGSGILDVIAELRKNKIIDNKGRLDEKNKYVRGQGKEQEFVVVRGKDTVINHDIVINRKDISEILLAKAAIQTGILILLDVANLPIKEINQIIVAGAFGSYLDIDNAIEIGMFPKLPLDCFKQVGNAAGIGAKSMLISEEIREQGRKFADNTNYVELTSFPSFQKIYLKSLKFTRIFEDSQI